MLLRLQWYNLTATTVWIMPLYLYILPSVSSTCLPVCLYFQLFLFLFLVFLCAHLTSWDEWSGTKLNRLELNSTAYSGVIIHNRRVKASNSVACAEKHLPTQSFTQLIHFMFRWLMKCWMYQCHMSLSAHVCIFVTKTFYFFYVKKRVSPSSGCSSELMIKMKMSDTHTPKN